MEHVWGETISPRDMIFEYMVPSSQWSHGTDSHVLVIDLPGFKKEEVRLRADKYGHVIVSGERQVEENKLISFKQSFVVPPDSAIEETSGDLEDGVFYITIPKKRTKENKVSEILTSSTSVREQDHTVVADCYTSQDNDEHTRNSEETDHEEDENEEFHDAVAADQWNENSMLKKPSNKLRKNRMCILTAVLAFSLGVLLSHRYQSNVQLE